MLKRKIQDDLMEWKRTGSKPLVVRGQRQVGKTFILKHFAEDNFKTCIYADLSADSDFAKIFTSDDRSNVDSMIFYMGLLRGIKTLDPADTVIFLDEIQDCPEAFSSLKTFAEDGRYKVIASGSMIGVTDFIIPNPGKKPPLSPMGYTKDLTMYSMDFEEFLWACGIPQEIIDQVRTHIADLSPIEEPVFGVFSKLFRTYQIVGGMPASVHAYVEDRSTYANCFAELEEILIQYRCDITKYCTKKGALKISECFSAIPAQLAENNKRFHYSRISSESVENRNSRRAADRYMENLLWIKDAGYGNFCYAVSQISSPLEGQVRRDVFKVYLSDTGLLVRMYGEKAAIAVFSSDSAYNLGAVTENAVAEALMKCGYSPRYYANNNGKNRMEIDFVLEFFEGLVAVEVKSGRSRNAPSLRKVADCFPVKRRIMFENGNIRTDNDGIQHLPLFTAAFINVLDPKPEMFRRPQNNADGHEEQPDKTPRSKSAR